MKTLILIGLIIFSLTSYNTSFAQCMLYEVPISDRIQSSSAIIEGKVISQSSFWNSAHTLIYTSNIIEVYKVFKGQITTSNKVEMITEGGAVGNDMHRVEPSLNLRIGQIGVFFADATNVLNSKSNIPGSLKFKPYASVQGFIKYDLIEKKGADPFKRYDNIESNIYLPITQRLNHNYKEIRHFNIHQLNDTK